MTDRIGHRFSRQGLLEQALTHRSAGAPHNERLEFLGDALVNLIVAEALYAHWPSADEGALTRARAELVRESALAPIARHLELGARLTLGPGEMKSGGHRRDSILADALEAVVAEIGPHVTAVAGLTAYRTAFERPRAVLGRQPEPISGSHLWVVPNPSGLNAHETIDSLAVWYRRAGEDAGLL